MSIFRYADSIRKDRYIILKNSILLFNFNFAGHRYGFTNNFPLLTGDENNENAIKFFTINLHLPQDMSNITKMHIFITSFAYFDHFCNYIRLLSYIAHINRFKIIIHLNNVFYYSPCNKTIIYKDIYKIREIIDSRSMYDVFSIIWHKFEYFINFKNGCNDIRLCIIGEHICGGITDKHYITAPITLS